MCKKEVLQMDNKEMMNGRVLSDDELEDVSGGRRVGAWHNACDKYVCQMCGSANRKINGHASGCTVPAIARPQASGWDLMGTETNGCWSCMHARYGTSYPQDEEDVWCQCALGNMDL